MRYKEVSGSKAKRGGLKDYKKIRPPIEVPDWPMLGKVRKLANLTPKFFSDGKNVYFS